MDQVNSQNKAEKKARKELVKLGLKPVEGVHSVTMKKAPNTLFTIANPEVYKSSGGGVETYAVYGTCTIDDGSNSARGRPSRARAAPRAAASAPAPSEAASAAPAAAAVEESNGEDLDGLSEKDVQMVISQVGVDRAKAIATLKKNGGDIINSIMDLTM